MTYAAWLATAYSLILGVSLLTAQQISQAPGSSQPVLVPNYGPAFAPTPSGTSLGGIAEAIPIAPYLNGTTVPENTLLQNFTIRFIGENLTNATTEFREAVESVAPHVFGNDNLHLEFAFRPGVPAPIYGPSGLNGTRQAYAPTPGQVPEGFGRKLLQSQKPFSQDTYANRFTIFMSIDVEVLSRGGSAGSLVQIMHPSQLMGFLSVVMAQHSLQVQTTPINMSHTEAILPIARRSPLRTVYVLGTVLQVTGTDITPANTQAQNMILLALLGLYGSQSVFLFNRIGAVWQSSTPSQDVVRFGIYTYTNSYISSMNEIAGGDIATLMTQVAQATGANFTVLVISSDPLGTRDDELMGSPRFHLDVATPASQRRNATTSSDDLSGGAIAGIVIGSVAGAAIALALAAFLALFLLRRRKPAKQVDDVEGIPNSHPLQKAILGSGGADHSSGIMGSTNGSSMQNSPSTELMHPLSEAWNIDPSELAVCQLSDGRDWLLGTGSFGRVFRGLRGGVQDVAIKQIIKPGDMHLRMFEKEVALLRHLNFDKNLVQFYGACVADDNLMLVLEYMDGGDLKDVLGNDPVGEFGWYGKGGSVLMDVARGLHFLHNNKVAHRDLKTKNILLNKAGEAKIGDVGLAKLVGSQLLSTQLDTAGTFAYAAPELLLGEPCDQSADIYSFGVIMWELLTHEIPVRGALRGIEVPKEGPQEAADLIELCLLRCPKARPTAKEIFDMLQSLLSLPGSTLPPVLESIERQSEEPRSQSSDEVPELNPVHQVPAAMVNGNRPTDSGTSNFTEVATGETAASSISTGPRASPEASKKRLQSY